jgi:[FeFe] hydrogenase H-cluster maturation GTPase HydF
MDSYAALEKRFSAAESVSGEADLWSYPANDPRSQQTVWGNFNQLAELKAKAPHMKVSIAVGGWTLSDNFSAVCSTPAGREAFLIGLRQALLAVCPDDFLRPPPLIGDLVPPGGLAVLVVPIDTGAPQGRLILPQVQTIRDALDHDAAALVVKDRDLAHVLGRLTTPPDLVVCDSQVVQKMVADLPLAVPCTTFSILFARLKGDLPRLAAGAAAVDRLRSGDRVLIAESCSHHAREDDIGRVKIPRWLRQYTGVALQVDTLAGRDFAADLSPYKLVIQCGGCMVTRREVLHRMQQAQAAGVPITNYGVCIAQTQGVLRRVLSPFPAALQACESSGG